MTTSIANTPLSEKLKTIPGFLGIRLEEEPKFFVLLREKDKQVRKYYSFLVAQTYIRGDRDFCVNEGFYRLTNYIFGSNTLNEKMSMAAPVLQGKSRKFIMAAPVLHEQKSDGWMMSFILPSKYKFETLPKPLVDNIEIIKVPSLLVASVRYNGTNGETKIKDKSSELISWLEGKDDYNILSEPRIAQYDAPHTLPFLRRNEIHVTVEEIPRRRQRSQ